MSMPQPLKLLLLGVLLVLQSACVSQPVDEISKRNPREASELNARLGLEYMRKGNNDEALTKLNKAIEFDPENADAHHYLAELYRRLGKYDLADEQYQAALDLPPDDPDLSPKYSALKNNYGVFLCDRERYKDAIRYFNEALADPLYLGKTGTYENMGLCTQRQGDIFQAEKYLRQALANDPRRPSALLAMAQISFDRNRMTSAYAFYQRYLEVAPQTPQSLWLGFLLERRRGNKDNAGSYAMGLKGRYPDSDEAKLLEKMEMQEAR